MSNQNDSTPHGFKGIDARNWQKADEQTRLWLEMTSVDRTEPEWLAFFANPKVSPKVPNEIAGLLETARAAMIYSWHYYPLATLGAEQCWRVLETGVRERCLEVGIPTKRTRANGREWDTSFSENVDALMARNLLRMLDKSRWDAVRRLRNSTSHPIRQMILDPGQAQAMLQFTVDVLNDLFQ